MNNLNNCFDSPELLMDEEWEEYCIMMESDEEQENEENVGLSVAGAALMVLEEENIKK